MLDFLLTIAAAYSLVVAALAVAFYPPLVGKMRVTRATWGQYAFVLVQCAVLVLLAGRVLGWW